jgi:hypothetical protein
MHVCIDEINESRMQWISLCGSRAGPLGLCYWDGDIGGRDESELLTEPAITSYSKSPS